MVAAYKSDMLTAMIRDELASRPRGAAARLAEATGVTPQTVTKWSKGEVTPEPERWPVIEAHFGWPDGEITRRVVPALGTDTTLDLIEKLSGNVLDLADRVAELERSQSRRVDR